MADLIILGATGSLGRHVLRQALAGGHRVTVLVRNTRSSCRPTRKPESRCRPATSTSLRPASSPDWCRRTRRARQLRRVRRSRSNLRRAFQSPGRQPGLAARGRAAGLLVPCGGGAPRRKSVGPPGGRPAQGEVDVLAAPDQFRPPRAFAARLAPAVPGADGRRAGTRPGQAAHFARPLADRSSRVRSRAAGRPVSAGLIIAHSADDRAVRGRGRAHARQPRSRWPHGAPPRRPRAALGHARPQATSANHAR